MRNHPGVVDHDGLLSSANTGGSLDGDTTCEGGPSAVRDVVLTVGLTGFVLERFWKPFPAVLLAHAHGCWIVLSTWIVNHMLEHDLLELWILGRRYFGRDNAVDVFMSTQIILGDFI